jgi:hypothetical protein
MRVIVYLSLLFGSAAFAQQIYKSIDGQGNVIYSEQPPTSARDVELVDPPAEPSVEELRAAEELQQRREQFIEQSETERLEQAQQRRELRESRQAPLVPASTVTGARGGGQDATAEGEEQTGSDRAASRGRDPDGGDAAGDLSPGSSP